MAEGLKIQIGADVSQAVAGLKQVEASMQKTASAGKSFETSVGKTGQALGKIVTPSNQATLALTNLGRVAQDAPFGFIGIANNLNPLLESFQRLKATTGTTGGALKALGKELTGAGGLGFALSIASSLAIVFGDRLFGAGKAAKEAKSSADQLRDSINGIFQSSAKEASEAAGFVAILKSETETRQRKLEAIKELQRIQPEIFNNLKLEGDAVIGLDKAYQAYLENLKTVIAAKIKQAQLEQLIEKQLRQQGVTLTASQKALVDATGKFREAQQNDPRLQGGDAAKIKKFYSDQEVASKKAADSLANDIDSLISDLSELSKGISTKELKVTPNKITIDDQLAQIIKLDKPIPVSATIDLKDVEVITSADLLKPAEDITSNIGKSLSKLVTAPKIQIAPEVTEGLKKAREELLRMQQDALFVANAISGAFGRAFDSIAQGQNVFQAVGEALKELVLGLIKAALQALILRAILSAVPGGAALSGLQGGLADAFGGFRAAGGPVSSGRAYVVGENGPEIFTPSVSGNIIPNNSVGGFSGRGSFSSGSQRQIVRGQNIILASARTIRGNSRLGNG